MWSRWHWTSSSSSLCLLTASCTTSLFLSCWIMGCSVLNGNYMPKYVYSKQVISLLLNTTTLAVSLLSNISKALKRLIYIKTCILDYYSISISHCQFGFCKKSPLQHLHLYNYYFNDLCSSKNKLTVLQIALFPDVKIGIKGC